MSVHELQIKARTEWYGSRELQRQFTTPECYWWEKYQRVYCPNCRADFAALAAGSPNVAMRQYG